ncbi:MgtC/SapB family protein [Fictibacillus sp. 18YEL24]|uniref:MgtC/SapB family protein n=1 Tax=Fictibacillus sp. 18YEL24 TaxID=2745875 RepID=UPI00210811BF|nr:MgtC/SapB family protein [Fictibacillus sp. 18YEL24]
MSDTIRMDPMRLTAQIVAGLGFLGGGVIIKDGVQVKGLTSAAMILLAGGVGIGIGTGFYGIVSFAVVISLVLAKLGNHMESRKMARLEREMNKNEVHL